MIGDDCPECGRRLGATGTCENIACGWAPSKAKAEKGELRYSCDTCNAPTRIVQLTPGDDGQSRCASCHVAYLKHRALMNPVTPEERAKHQAALAAALQKADEKWKTTRAR